MKAAKECCRRTFCARSLIFMASASIIFWNELIKRTKTTADAVVFSIKMWRAQQRRLGRHSRNGIIQSKREGLCPSLLVVRGAWAKSKRPCRSLGGQRGPFSHVREWPPYPVQRLRRCLPRGTSAAASFALVRKRGKGNKKPPPGEARASCCVVCVFLGGRKSHRGEFPFASIKIPVNLG